MKRIWIRTDTVNNTVFKRSGNKDRKRKKGEEKRENKGIKKKYGGQNKIVLCEAKNGKLYHKYTIFLNWALDCCSMEHYKALEYREWSAVVVVAQSLNSRRIFSVLLRGANAIKV